MIRGRTPDSQVGRKKVRFLMLGPSDPFTIYLRDTGKLKERLTES